MALKTELLSEFAAELISDEGYVNYLARLAQNSEGCSKSESMGYTNARQCAKQIREVAEREQTMDLYERQLAELQRKNDLLEAQIGGIQRANQAPELPTRPRGN